MKWRFLICVGLTVLIFSGCAPEFSPSLWGCPGAKSLAEALELLGAHNKIEPLGANGQCLLEYYDIEGKKHRENFPIKLWMNPPIELYLQGDIAFDPKALIVGANEDEFWLSIKPKKISGYWWGRWTEAQGPEQMMISPEMILEAFGIIDTDTGGRWTLSKVNRFDVLVKREGGVIRRNIYISNCDYLVRRIEYFDKKGKAVATVRLGKYKEINEAFLVPGFVKADRFDESNQESKLEIRLGAVKSVEITEQQRDRLFVRPEPQGFKNIYKIINGDVIEQD